MIRCYHKVSNPFVELAEHFGLRRKCQYPPINPLSRSLLVKNLLWTPKGRSEFHGINPYRFYLPAPNPGIAGKIACRTRRGYRS